jgi:caa(3)-type oxidase subunit IV
LILWFFMDVKNAERLVWLVALAGFFWLSILIGGTLADYWTRSDFPFSEVIRSDP